MTMYPLMSAAPNRAWRHHYVPQFHLRRWTGSDGMLWRYERRPDRVLRRRTAPRATAYERELYTTHELLFPEEASDVLETDFFSRLDSDAAIAFRRLIDDG